MSFDLSPEKLALLDALLDDEEDVPSSIARRIDRAHAPLSFAQERLWFVDRLVPDNPAYNIPVVIDLEGPLDVAAMASAVEALGARHEMLRARVVSGETGPVWAIDPASSVRLVVEEVEAQRADDIERSEARSPFDLQTGPLWRIRLLRLEPDRHRLLFTMHHIVSEAWTCALLLREMSSLMRGDALAEPSLDYGDFAAWQRATNPEGLSFFAEHLAPPLPVLDLPTDRPRPAERRFVGDWVERHLDRSTTAAIGELARAHRCTLYMTLLAVFDVLMHRWTGDVELVVGSPVSLRDRIELEDVVGFFVNTVALRQRIDPDASFATLLGSVRETALDVFARRSVPFEQVVETVSPDRSLAQNPVFQVAMVVQDTPEHADWRSALHIEGVKARPRIRPSATSKFDLTLEAEQVDERLRIAFEFDTDLFDRSTAETMLRQLEQLIVAACEAPETAVGDLRILDADDERWLLENNPPALAPPSETVHGAFASIAAEHGERVAVVDEGDVVSYARLDRWSRSIAARLRDAGATAGEVIGVSLPRSAALIAAELAILRIGAAYLPLDASYPEERRALMLEDAGVRLIVGDGISTDEPKPSVDKELPDYPGTPDDVAYVLFTSGSTGRPKGVLTPHRGIVRLVREAGYIELGPSSVLAQVANAAFDAITFEVWGALLNGGKVVIVPPDDAINPDRLASTLRRHGVTAMFLTTALFNRVAAERPDAFDDLDTLIVGGEALDPKWVRRVLDIGGPKRFLNGYGPTETTTFATTHHVRDVASNAISIPIGRPIGRTRAYVVDSRGNLVPPGVHGELLLAGAGVALGYLERPGLTQERFVTDPFGEGTVYRTGDIVRWLPDGTLDFVGRRDNQIKLRGFRIELGEIEARLEEHPSVRQAVCVVCGLGAERRVVGYVVGDEHTKLRDHLQERLPSYMVPSVFVFLEALPLDPNGKVDRKALPDPQAERSGSPLRSATERAVAAAFTEVLSRTRIDAEDDFFELGGSSLLAVPLFRALSERFGVDLPLATLFRASTVRALAHEVDARRVRQTRAETLEFGPFPTGRFRTPPFEPLVPIQPRGARPALYCVHGAGGNVVGFRDLAKHLGGDQPFYAFQGQGIDGVRPPLATIEAMARQYADALLEHDPAGSYRLAGYSGGGVIAFELAHELRRRGQDVALVVMLDAGAGRPTPESDDERRARRLEGLRRGGLGYVSEKIRERLVWDAWRLRSKAAELGKWIGRPIPHDMRNRLMVEAFARARHRYALNRLEVPIVVLSARLGTRSAVEEAELGWSAFSPSVRALDVPGDHGTLLIQPHVRELARVLRSVLD